jgi:hypothetical protein
MTAREFAEKVLTGQAYLDVSALGFYSARWIDGMIVQASGNWYRWDDKCKYWAKVKVSKN